MTEIPELSLYTDGASRGNPGEGGAGVVLVDHNGREVTTLSRYLGLVTNNAAEYHALLLGLKEAQSLHTRRLKVFMDSELVVKQLKGEYKIKNSNLLPLYDLAQEAISYFESVEFFHIPREKNYRADTLANRAIDEHTG
ncbi:MAG TPA: ribonuclease HI family protein [Bdellovibrionota bacterium]|nr:ribonuclease HI family protein [Bdellovibrionota bacterium]